MLATPLGATELALQDTDSNPEVVGRIARRVLRKRLTPSSHTLVRPSSRSTSQQSSIA